jgi:hypothetical protein
LNVPGGGYPLRQTRLRLPRHRHRSVACNMAPVLTNVRQVRTRSGRSVSAVLWFGDE